MNIRVFQKKSSFFFLLFSIFSICCFSLNFKLSKTRYGALVNIFTDVCIIILPIFSSVSNVIVITKWEKAEFQAISRVN